MTIDDDDQYQPEFWVEAVRWAGRALGNGDRARRGSMTGYSGNSEAIGSAMPI